MTSSLRSTTVFGVLSPLVTFNFSAEEERRRLQDFGWNENENSTLKKADGTDKESVEMTKILKQGKHSFIY